MANSFYARNEIEKMGFAYLGEDVNISRNAKLYGVSEMKLGSHVRIDDFCVLSGNVELGCYIHIAVYSALFGGTAGIKLCDFSNISSRVCIYAISDDFSGESMTNPTIPEKYKNLVNKSVTVNRHAVIGSGSTILPGADIGEGTAIGAMSLVRNPVDEWSIYAGIPAKKIGKRKKELLSMEGSFLNETK